MRQAKGFLGLAAIAMVLLASAPRQAAARPQYHKAFMEKYPAIKAEAGELKCAVCHGGKEGKTPKIRSEYAKELEKALELKQTPAGKNIPEKNAAKIMAAMGKIEDKKPEGGDKTYGELFKDGKLPPPAPKE